jgi:hypothetical protein
MISVVSGSPTNNIPVGTPIKIGNTRSFIQDNINGQYNGLPSNIPLSTQYPYFVPQDNNGVSLGIDNFLPGYWQFDYTYRRVYYYAVYCLCKPYIFPNGQKIYYSSDAIYVKSYSVKIWEYPDRAPYPLTEDVYKSLCPPPIPAAGYDIIPRSKLIPRFTSSYFADVGSIVLDQNVTGYKYSIDKALKDNDKPCYRHLITGYKLDSRSLPSQLTITSTTDKFITVGYYKRNKLEPIPNLISVDWVNVEVALKANVQFLIDITDIVLGTLYLSKPVLAQSNGTIPYAALFSTGLNDLFNYWMQLYTSDNLSTLPYVSETKKIHLISANNNIWNNNPSIEADINYDINHPLFVVDNQRAYNWHIKPVSEGIGTLIMDSPRTIEIHAALEAAKYTKEVPAIIGTGTADNPQTPAIHTLGYSIANGGGQKLDEIHKSLEAAKYTKEVPAIIGTGTADNPQTPAIHTLGYSIANGGGQKLDEIHKSLEADKYSRIPGSNSRRIATLGHLISKISSILGYRPEPDGNFIEDTEKTLVRKIVSSNYKVDKTKIGVNNFGSDGMLLKRLNNRFDGDKIAHDECVIVKDLPQLLAEYQDQINLALGLQESSAVEIKNNSETSRYSNQLSMLSELLNLASSNHDMIRAALISSLIAQGQTSETIAALGLPTVTKTLPIDVDGKITHLPYKGVAPHRSISQEVATCTQNVGIVLGQLL